METLPLTQRELEELLDAIRARQVAELRTRDERADDRSLHTVLGPAPESASPLPMEHSPGVRKLASLIDHTLLRPEATRTQVEQLCREATEWGCAGVCVNPAWVPCAAERLRGTGVRVATVVGFPFGATPATVKRAEAQGAILEGAREIDMVMNIGALRSGELERVESDIRGVVEVCHAASAIVKVILENAYLSDGEKVQACHMAQRAGADYVKTSTGFGPSGATEADVRLMRRTVGPAVGVKAAGGIRTLPDALRFLRAGATRLGATATRVILAEAAGL